MLLQVSEGNEHAFRQMFDTYRSKLYTYIIKITESREMAEDVVHDVFLKIWSNRKELPKVENLNAYLYVMAERKAIDGLRKMARQTLVTAVLENQSEYSSENPDETLVRKEVRQYIQDAVGKLTPQQKEVFRMSKELGLKQEDIAKRLNISIFTVKKHLTDAMNFIRNEIARTYGSQAIAIFVIYHLFL